MWLAGRAIANDIALSAFYEVTLCIRASGRDTYQSAWSSDLLTVVLLVARCMRCMFERDLHGKGPSFVPFACEKRLYHSLRKSVWFVYD